MHNSQAAIPPPDPRYSLFLELTKNARGELYAQARPDLALLLFEAAMLLYQPPEDHAKQTLPVIRELMISFTRLGFRDRAHALLPVLETMLAQQPQPDGQSVEREQLEFAIKCCATRARMLADMGRHGEALTQHRAALPLLDQRFCESKEPTNPIKWRAKWFELAGTLHEGSGNARQAVRAFNRARHLWALIKPGKGRDSSIATLCYRIAHALQLLNRHTTAARVFNALLVNAANEERNISVIHAHAVSLAALGHDAEALTLAREALSAFENRRSHLRSDSIETGFIESHIDKYDLVISHTARQPQSEEAVLALIGRAKARLFSKRLLGEGNISTVTATAGIALAGRAGELRTKYADTIAAAAQILEQVGDASAAGEALALRQQISEMLEADGDNGDFVPPDAKRLRATLPPDTLALEFYQLADELIIVAISRDLLRVLRIPIKDTEVHDAVHGLAATVTASQQRMVPSRELSELFYWQATDLYRRLCNPLAELLAAQSRLLLCPHRAWHRIPFAMLRNPEGKLLGETHAVAYLPALGSLLRAIPVAAMPKTALIVSNSTGELRHASAEAAAVAALFSQAHHFDGAKATVAAFREHVAAADVIHIACHNRFDPHGIIHTHIPLADGPLPTGDIFRCSLPRAPLVVLSACDSGLAQERRSDELDSFAHAFIAAGARAVLVTLWPIDDSVTPELMRSFYAAFLQSTDPAAALRAAQQHAHARGLPPHIFGAFKMVQ